MIASGRLTRANELRRRAETHLISAGWLSARELLEDALELYRDEADAVGVVACLRGLGDVAAKLNEQEVAAENYQAALDAVVPTDHLSRAECLLRQADLHRTQGNLMAARDGLTAASEEFAAAGHRKGEAQCLGLLGEVGRAAGDKLTDVLPLYRQAHGIQMEIGDLRGAAVTLTFIANLVKEKDPAAAAEAFVQAAHIYEGLGLHHRAEPFLSAARRLDPANTPAPTPRVASPWDDDD